MHLLRRHTSASHQCTVRSTLNEANQTAWTEHKQLEIPRNFWVHICVQYKDRMKSHVILNDNHEFRKFVHACFVHPAHLAV